MSDALKPCPHCGNTKPEAAPRVGRGRNVYCLECGAEGPFHLKGVLSPDEAWNVRAFVELTVPEGVALRKLLVFTSEISELFPDVLTDEEWRKIQSIRDAIQPAVQPVEQQPDLAL